jgi:hypothetical protein
VSAIQQLEQVLHILSWRSGGTLCIDQKLDFL